MEEHQAPLISGITVPGFDRIPYHGRIQYHDNNHELRGFHLFPQRAQWNVDLHSEILNCKPNGSTNEPNNQTSAEHFLQAWLFCGLLHTVLGHVDQRIRSCNFEQFIDSRGPAPYVSLDSLRNQLPEWESFELRQDDKAAQNLRMVRIQMALDQAREVVKRCCSLADNKERYNERDRVSDEVLFSIIVLGEALSNAKTKIVERLACGIRGWHGEVHGSWGTRDTILRMRPKNWCPRAVHSLSHQLRGSTIGLIVAFTLHPNFDGKSHGDCNSESCRRTSFEDPTQPGAEGPGHNQPYNIPHNAHCGSAVCAWQGPDVRSLLDIIENGGIPLLVFPETQGGRMEVRPYREGEDYATISHVWSDGYGNPNRNQMRECQLNFLRESILNAQGKRQRDGIIPFWIDTLSIPVWNILDAGIETEEKFRIMRGRAIRQIHDIFDKSTYTIVIDGSLINQRVDPTYPGNAIKILASGWMRRLWTLQEAYLSMRLFFQFQNHCMDLDELESMYHRENDGLFLDIPATARNYFHNLLGTARKARIHGMTPREGLNLISSVWKASQWRTTSRAQHEALALASLLNLNNKHDSGGAQFLNENFALTVHQTLTEHDERLEKGMQKLWLLLEEFYPGSIPPGMIFLPPPKLLGKGFGWAPKTFMSGKEIEYPDPLSMPALTRRARLEVGKGLHVQYPGFLLHSSAGQSEKILLTTRSKFTFPSDNTLMEWYGYRRADLPSDVNDLDSFDELSVESQRQPDHGDSRAYAIIIPRERPHRVEEIGLLVQIDRIQKQGSYDDTQETIIFHVLIKFRIWVRRYTGSEIEEEMRDFSAGISENEAVFAEVLGPTQRWCVDQRQPSRESGGVSETEGNGGNDDSVSIMGSMKRRVTSLFFPEQKTTPKPPTEQGSTSRQESSKDWLVNQKPLSTGKPSRFS